MATVITSKALGGILFVFGSSFGAYILVRILFLLGFCGALPRVVAPVMETDNCFSFQLFYLALVTPILYDFYNYSHEKDAFGALLNDFLQVCVTLMLDGLSAFLFWKCN